MNSKMIFGHSAAIALAIAAMLLSTFFGISAFSPEKAEAEAAAAATVNLTANPESPPIFGTTTLTWNNTNVETCGFWSTHEHWFTPPADADILQGSMEYKIMNCTVVQLSCLDAQGNEVSDKVILSPTQQGQTTPMNCAGMDTVSAPPLSGGGRGGLNLGGGAMPDLGNVMPGNAGGGQIPVGNQDAGGGQGNGQCNANCQTQCNGGGMCNAVCERACNAGSANNCGVRCENGTCTVEGNCGNGEIPGLGGNGFRCAIRCENGQCASEGDCVTNGGGNQGGNGNGNGGGNGNGIPDIGSVFPGLGGNGIRGIGACIRDCAGQTCFGGTNFDPANIRQCMMQCTDGCLGNLTAPAPAPAPATPPANTPAASPAAASATPTSSEQPIENATAEISSANECRNEFTTPADFPAQFSSNFASPFDRSGLNILMMGVYCDAAGARLSVGDDLPTTYVHSRAYLTKDTATWQAVNLVGTGAQENDWLVGSARAELPISVAETANGHHFAIAYICSWSENKWQCGCSGDTCDNSKWNIQAFTGNK